MAFTKTANYNNLPNGNFSPIIYSQKVQKFFRTASVAEAIQTLTTQAKLKILAIQ